jgi:hypothetical protein
MDGWMRGDGWMDGWISEVLRYLIKNKNMNKTVKKKKYII